MRLVRGLARGELRGAVAGYADFLQRSEGPVETREPATAGIVLILDLDSGWTVEGERFGSFAGGIYLRPVRVAHEGRAAGVQVDLEPTALTRLTGVPARELWQRTVRLEDVLGREGELLAESLAGLPQGAARFAALDEVLGRGLAAAPPHPYPDLEIAWRLLRSSQGRMRIEALARAVGCSRRHLARRFDQEIGMSPKQAARLMRFEAARRQLRSGDLARVASDCGYADQAHLSREFREFAGVPPTRVPFLQDAATAGA